jgi:hypothetical protein
LFYNPSFSVLFFSSSFLNNLVLNLEDWTGHLLSSVESTYVAQNELSEPNQSKQAALWKAAWCGVSRGWTRGKGVVVQGVRLLWKESETGEMDEHTVEWRTVRVGVTLGEEGIYTEWRGHRHRRVTKTWAIPWSLLRKDDSIFTTQKRFDLRWLLLVLYYKRHYDIFFLLFYSLFLCVIHSGNRKVGIDLT